MSAHLRISLIVSLAAFVFTASACLDTEPDPGYCGSCKEDASTLVDGQVADGAANAGDADVKGDGQVGLIDGAVGDGAVDVDSSVSGDGGGNDACAQTCAGDEPVCDAMTKKCVQCTAAEHGACKGATAVCNVFAHECVACTATQSGACKGGTPVCDLTHLTCAECNTPEQCKTTSKSNCDDHVCSPCSMNEQCEHLAKTPVCDIPNHECATCNDDADCPSSKKANCEAHECVPCGADMDCEHLSATPICDEVTGNCVECSGTDYAACGKAPDDTPYVCDSAAHLCTKNKEHKTGPCGACVSDAQCKSGQICAEQKFGSPAESVGHFCFWKNAATEAGGPAGNCDVVRPHIKTILDVMSVDGETAVICAPRVSTCPALNDVSKNCESSSAPGTPDSSKCGFTHSQENNTTHEDQDGFCVDTNPTAATNFKCTVKCNNDDLDCSDTCDTSEVPNLCTL